MSVSCEVRREEGERDPGAWGPGGTVTETGRGVGWGATRSLVTFPNVFIHYLIDFICKESKVRPERQPAKHSAPVWSCQVSMSNPLPAIRLW